MQMATSRERWGKMGVELKAEANTNWSLCFLWREEGRRSHGSWSGYGERIDDDVCVKSLLMNYMFSVKWSKLISCMWGKGSEITESGENGVKWLSKRVQSVKSDIRHPGAESHCQFLLLSHQVCHSSKPQEGVTRSCSVCHLHPCVSPDRFSQPPVYTVGELFLNTSQFFMSPTLWRWAFIQY